MHQREILGWVVALAVAGCAGASSDVKPEQWRSRLRAAMGTEIETRDQRDELSRVLIDAVDAGVLDRLTAPEVQAAFGSGLLCDGYELCARQGFQGSDWYYLIGHAVNDDLRQLPVLIVGFDTHGRVSRVYTLRTH